MCKYPKLINKPNIRPTAAQPYSRILSVVPCGHCVDCLKQRQSNFATRIYLEARKGAMMFFVTFTYANENLPIASRLVKVDKESGETEVVSPYKICDKEVADLFRSEIVSQPATSKARFAYKNVFETESSIWQAEFTPSLNRKDVRDWLKKGRIQYKREFGHDLPDFKYAFCGEYGPRGGRPHYHALFIGLDYEALSWLLIKWTTKFGYTYTKEIPILNADGSDARLIVARYVGKYIAKGKFDLDSCKNLCCEKGRLCNSLNLGNSLTDEEIAYYRAYDLYGEYDIDSFVLQDTKKCEVGQKLTDIQISRVVEEVIKRRKISLGVDAEGKEIKRALPMYLCKKLYCIKDYYEELEPLTHIKKSKVRYVGSLLSSKVAAFQRDKFISRYILEYRKVCPEVSVSDLSIETYFEILLWSKGSEMDAKEAHESALLQRQYFSNEKDHQ